MKNILYTSPWVPPEWIAAHGFRPVRRLPLGPAGSEMQSADCADYTDRNPAAPGLRREGTLLRCLREGQCPFAWAMACEAARGGNEEDAGRAKNAGKRHWTIARQMPATKDSCAAVIFTTTCDQMRRAGQDVQASVPVFLLNVPATWQTAGARRLYVDELARLGRFLEQLAISNKQLARNKKQRLKHDGGLDLRRTWRVYQAARDALMASRARLTGREFVERLLHICSSLPVELERLGAVVCGGLKGSTCPTGGFHATFPKKAIGGFLEHSPAIPVAVVGGGLTGGDLCALDAIERLGGRIVLNGMEAGERCLPAGMGAVVCGGPKGQLVRRSLGEAGSNHATLSELAEAYMGIPDAFRRPDDALHAWLGENLPASGARGLVVLRQVWCDLWHAQVARIRRGSPVPVLDLDISCTAAGSPTIEGRIQAFLEILR